MKQWIVGLRIRIDSRLHKAQTVSLQADRTAYSRLHTAHTVSLQADRLHVVTGKGILRNATSSGSFRADAVSQLRALFMETGGRLL